MKCVLCNLPSMPQVSISWPKELSVVNMIEYLRTIQTLFISSLAACLLKIQLEGLLLTKSLKCRLLKREFHNS